MILLTLPVFVDAVMEKVSRSLISLWGTSLCIGRSGDAFERRVEGGYTEDCWSCGLGDSGVDLIPDNIVGQTGSSAGSAVTLRLGIVALRWSISISDEDGVLRRPELGFGYPPLRNLCR
jgi:hypothetical protein